MCDISFRQVSSVWRLCYYRLVFCLVYFRNLFEFVLIKMETVMNSKLAKVAKKRDRSENWISEDKVSTYSSSLQATQVCIRCTSFFNIFTYIFLSVAFINGVGQGEGVCD